MKQTELQEILKQKGLKTTNQRVLVFKALESCPGKHFTAEELYDVIKVDYPEIGLATVYRTIQLFLELNLIDKINLDDGFVRYEIVDNNNLKHHHHHFICVECGKVYSFEEDLLEDFEAHVEKAFGFKILNHEVKLYGLCKVCLQKNWI